MTKQSIIYFDGGAICKTQASYKVMLEREFSIVFIPISDVEHFKSMCNEDEYLIAALLAYIEFVRKSTITDTVYLCKIKESTLIKNIKILLTTYSIERITNVLRDLKWHEIHKILTSKTPIEEINNFV